MPEKKFEKPSKPSGLHKSMEREHRTMPVWAHALLAGMDAFGRRNYRKKLEAWEKRRGDDLPEMDAKEFRKVMKKKGRTGRSFGHGAKGYKTGGKVKMGYKKGGSVKSIDGIAQRGKTRGTMR